jgi:periplasmic glucans biosynthesis protein
MGLDRRIFLGSAAAALAMTASSPALAVEQFEELAQTTLGHGRPFAAASVIETARALSRLSYEPPDTSLPEQYRDLDYERYIRIRTKPEAALFYSEDTDFAIEPLHRGFVFTAAVRLFVVRNGVVERIGYSPDLFRYGDVGVPGDAADLGFSGFRIMARDGGQLVEQAVFQGATYFRAIAKGQTLGAMARGLSVRTSEPGGEEFPTFRMFFIEKPEKGAPLVIHAIADSESLSAAFRFSFTSGEMAVMETDMTVFARTEIANYGIGGLQTTYFFGPNDRQGVDDLRAAAYENGGLQMQRGNGEWLWRPISNPADLQISAFVDQTPKGFGFLQRQRDLTAFEDDNQGFETRPSVWIEPVGDWGAGMVELVEIPTTSDINDNIITYWRPEGALGSGEQRQFIFRQSWCWTPPTAPDGPTIIQSRSGNGGAATSRRFMIEFSGESLKQLAANDIKVELSSSGGRFITQRLRHDLGSPVARLSFEIDNDGGTTIELRAVLLPHGAKPSETWLYRWTA